MKHSSLSHQKIFTNASILTALSVLERALGFVYRIVLSRLLGAEGIGMYQVAVSVFQVFLTIGTGGLPITVSRFITKHRAMQDNQGERQSASAGITLALLLTLPIAVIGIAFPSITARLFSDAHSAAIFRVLLIGLCFSAVYAVLRGCLWGNKRFLSAALLELAEESTMVLLGVLFLHRVDSAPSGATLVSWATTLARILVCVCAFFCFYAFGGRLSAPKKQIKPLFNATLPITFVRASGSLISSAISVLLPFSLMRAGATKAQALSEFGIISGMVLPFLFIPATVIGSLALVLVPEITEAYYKKDFTRLKTQIARGLQCAALVALFLIPFFYCLGDDIAIFAFSKAQVGEYVRKGCVILLPMSVAMIATSLLNAMGHEKKTFQYFFAGASAQLLCILLLPRFFGGFSYIIGLGCSYLVSGALTLFSLGKACPNLYQKACKTRGQGCVELLLKAFCVATGLCLFGEVSYAFFFRLCGGILTTVYTGLALAVATALTWWALDLFSLVLPNFKKKCGKKKKRLPAP